LGSAKKSQTYSWGSKKSSATASKVNGLGGTSRICNPEEQNGALLRAPDKQNSVESQAGRRNTWEAIRVFAAI